MQDRSRHPTHFFRRQIFGIQRKCRPLPGFHGLGRVDARLLGDGPISGLFSGAFENASGHADLRNIPWPAQVFPGQGASGVEREMSERMVLSLIVTDSGATVTSSWPMPSDTRRFT